MTHTFKLSKIKVLSTLLFISLPLFSQTFNWDILSYQDTLFLKVKGVCVGNISFNTKYSGSIGSIAVSSDVNIKQKNDNVKLLEERVYDSLGALKYAQQIMKSSMGSSSWRLKKELGNWILEIESGGILNRKKIDVVNDNLLTEYQITNAIINRKISIGNSWVDSSFDLVLGEQFFTKIRCVSIPTKYDRNYHFVNQDIRYGRDEKWIVDSLGHTVSQELPPLYDADHLPCQNVNSLKKVDLFELLKIKGEYCSNRIIVNVESPSILDSSILFLYKKRGEDFIFANSEREHIVNYDSRSWVGSSVTIQSDNKLIKKVVDSLNVINLEKRMVVKKLTEFVYEYLDKKIVGSFSNAVETLKMGYGDCSEHAVLLAALLRAAGIKATVVLGAVSIGKDEYTYHAWVIADVGDYALFADAALGPISKTACYLPLILDEDGAGAMRLMGVIGNLSIRCY